MFEPAGEMVAVRAGKMDCKTICQRRTCGTTSCCCAHKGNQKDDKYGSVHDPIAPQNLQITALERRFRDFRVCIKQLFLLFHRSRDGRDGGLRDSTA